MTKKKEKKGSEKKPRENSEPSVCEVHPSLFHYTTEAGLYGILESQELWATHFAFLNDSQEIVAARSAMVEALYSSLYELCDGLIRDKKMDLRGEITQEDLCSQEARRMVDVFYRVTLEHVTPYIFSFCSHNRNESEFNDGLLSQWRGYGRDGGFAIEFDSKELETLIVEDGLTCSHSAYHFGSVVYGIDDPDFQYLKGGLDLISSVAAQILPHAVGIQKEEPDIDSTYLPFVQCSTRMKHPGFREEREVRLVYVRPADGSVPEERLAAKDVEFRTGYGVRTPYVRLFHEIDRKLPIKRVIVGPHPKAKHRRDALSLFLSKKGIDSEIAISAIPYLPE